MEKNGKKLEFGGRVKGWADVVTWIMVIGQGIKKDLFN